jgi:hypothetical protein
MDAIKAAGADPALGFWFDIAVARAARFDLLPRIEFATAHIRIIGNAAGKDNIFIPLLKKSHSSDLIKGVLLLLKSSDNILRIPMTRKCGLTSRYWD